MSEQQKKKIQVCIEQCKHLLLVLGNDLLLVLAFLLSAGKGRLAMDHVNDETEEYVRGVLILLVFSNEILHVRLRLCELHLVHTLTSVPMQEGLPLEHGSELIADTLEELLDSGRVTEESDSHLVSTRSDLTLSGKNVVGNPLNEVSRVPVLHIVHLFLNFLHRDATTEDGGNLAKDEFRNRMAFTMSHTVR